ncbi:MAG: CBS domain-containing protein [Candidatus Hydrothermarchaeales archaeon]
MKKIRVSDIMTRDIVSLSADASIQEAANLMLDENVGSLGVKKDGVLVGIVTKTDFVRVLALGKKVENIGAVMSTLIKVSSDIDLIEVIGIMQKNNVKHLFVEESKNIVGIDLTGVVGILSLHDLLNYLPDIIRSK